MGVVATHTGQHVSGMPAWLKFFTDYGAYGVTLFFMASAYTLCLSSSRRASEHNSTLKYFVRRFFRIAPLYYLGIAFYFLFSILLNEYHTGTYFPDSQYTLLNIATNVFFVHGFYRPAYNYIVPGGWSIGTEMAFYCVFPMLSYFYVKIIKTNLQILLVPLFSAIICALFWRSLPHIFTSVKHDFVFYSYNLFNQLPVFLTGMSLFYFTAKFRFSRFHSIAALVLFIVLTLILVFRPVPDMTFNTLCVSLSFVLLFHLFKNLDFLNFKLLQKIGQLSYSIYVFHWIFAVTLTQKIDHLLEGNVNGIFIFLLQFVINVGLSILVALVTERYIEEKGIGLGRKLIQRI